MSDVSRDRFGVTGEVLDRAVEAGTDRLMKRWRAGGAYQVDTWLPSEEDHVRRMASYQVEEFVSACSPVIAEAGYREGVKAERARVEGLIDTVAKPSVGPGSAPIDKAHNAALADLLAALTDSEGRDE
jgi:hypothetical protein